MSLLTFIYLPTLAGILCLICPRQLKGIKEIISTTASLVFIIFAIQVFSLPDQLIRIPWFEISSLDFGFDFRLYHFSRFLLLFIGLFTFLTVLYSISYFKGNYPSHLYYSFLMFTLSGAALIILADNFFILLLGWEIVTLLLFFLIAMGQGKPAAMAAGKAFAILGFTDVALLFGVIALPIVYGTWNISSLNIEIGSTISIVIFLLLFVAAIAKAGAVPFHSWIPDAAKAAPLPVIALLPAALDKLLGIYLLARLTLDVFQINQTMRSLMLIIGAITIISANLMALIQSDIKKFLGFATITQMGFMLLGFGSGTTIGILGGLFHMLNHAIYKILLFFGFGVVEKETGTSDLNKLGGLAKSMPFTFTFLTIGIFAASGIPPFNAFVSKWMIYQSILDAGQPLFLIIAMFGSALTLATFLKVWFGTFMGPAPGSLSKKVKDGTILTRFTLLVPGLLCIIFGIAAQLPINTFISPILKIHLSKIPATINLGTAFYNPTLATILLLAGFEKEKLVIDHFYETMQKMKFLGGVLREGGKGVTDVYNLSSNLGLVVVNVLKKMHDGVLSTYLAWCIIGLGIISFILMVV